MSKVNRKIRKWEYELMKDWNETHAKIEYLKKYIKSEEYFTLDKKTQRLINKQLFFMKEYAKVMIYRIERENIFAE